MEHGQPRMDFPDGLFAVQGKHRSHCSRGVRLNVYSASMKLQTLGLFQGWHRKRDGTDIDADHARFRSYYSQVLIKKLLISKLQSGRSTYSGSLWKLGSRIYLLHIIKKMIGGFLPYQIEFLILTYIRMFFNPVGPLSQWYDMKETVFGGKNLSENDRWKKRKCSLITLLRILPQCLWYFSFKEFAFEESVWRENWGIVGILDKAETESYITGQCSWYTVQSFIKI